MENVLKKFYKRIDKDYPMEENINEPEMRGMPSNPLLKHNIDFANFIGIEMESVV